MNEHLKNFGSEIKHSFTDNKGTIIIVTVIFFAVLVLGFIFAKELQSTLSPLLQAFQQRVQSGEVQLTTDSLYLNNIRATLLIYLGSFLLGIVGISAIVTNALLIGYYGAVYSFNNQLPLFLALILPHGIFEIPSIILASSGGFILLKFLFKFLRNLISPDFTYTEVFDPIYNSDKITNTEKIKMSWRKNGKFLKQSLIILVISAILLIIAAFVEANITQQLASYFFNSI